LGELIDNTVYKGAIKVKPRRELLYILDPALAQTEHSTLENIQLSPLPLRHQHLEHKCGDEEELPRRAIGKAEAGPLLSSNAYGVKVE
jgi:hypothetical protein